MARKIKGKIVSVLVVAFLVAIIVLPLLVVFLLSIVPRWSTAFPTSFSLEWWMAAFKPKILKIVLNTILISLTSTAITVCYGIAAAYLFAFYEFRGKSTLSTLLLSPTYVPGIVIALGLLTMYPFLRNTFWMLSLGHFIVVSPIVFRYILSSMVNIPPSIVEASYSLGCSRIESFRRIILPLSRRGIFSGTILSIGMNVSELSVTLLLFGANWVTLPVQIYLERGWGTLGIAAVLSTILILVALATMMVVDFVGRPL